MQKVKQCHAEGHLAGTNRLSLLHWAIRAIRQTIIADSGLIAKMIFISQTAQAAKCSWFIE